MDTTDTPPAHTNLHRDDVDAVVDVLTVGDITAVRAAGDATELDVLSRLINQLDPRANGSSRVRVRQLTRICETRSVDLGDESGELDTTDTEPDTGQPILGAVPTSRPISPEMGRFAGGEGR